jgi:hypothetical protein
MFRRTASVAKLTRGASRTRLMFVNDWVFDFNEIPISQPFGKSPPAGLPGAATYKAFRPACRSYPDHLMDAGRDAFFTYCMQVKDQRIQALLDLTGTKMPEGDQAAKMLDRLGDQLGNALEIMPKAFFYLKKHKRMSYRYRHFERMIKPVWNSVLVDLSLLVGEVVRLRYKELNATWFLEPNITGNIYDLDLRHKPLLRMEIAKVNDPDGDGPDEDMDRMIYGEDYDLVLAENKRDQDFENYLYQTLLNNPALEKDIDAWEKVFYAARDDKFDFGENPMNPADYHPARIRKRREQIPFLINSPFQPAEYILDHWMRERFLPPSLRDEKLQSLGDILRPDTQPNQIGFVVPFLPIRRMSPSYRPWYMRR